MAAVFHFWHKVTFVNVNASGVLTVVLQGTDDFPNIFSDASYISVTLEAWVEFKLQ